jgi:hypothetical protein
MTIKPLEFIVINLQVMVKVKLYVIRPYEITLPGHLLKIRKNIIISKIPSVEGKYLI